MSAIPSHLVKLRALVEVPRSEYLGLTQNLDFADTQVRRGFLGMLRQRKTRPENKAVIASSAQNYEFNAAVWLSFSCPPKQPVSLWLSYKDLDGSVSVLVDEQRLENATSIMLSSSIRFDTNGPIEYLKACVGGISDEEIFSVEELHVQRIINASENGCLNQKTG